MLTSPFRCRLSLGLVCAAFGIVGAVAAPTAGDKENADWMGFGPPPGDGPAVFAPGLVSTAAHEHSAPTFSPDGREVYWSSFAEEKQTILFSRRIAGRWSPAQAAPFSGRYSDGGPCLSPDGARLYFYSERPLPDRPGELQNDLWYVDRAGDAWGKPRNAGISRLSSREKWIFAPSVAANGNVYVTGTLNGMHGLFVLENRGGALAPPMPLPAVINSSYDRFNWTAFVAPDERYLIFSSKRADSRGFNDLYVSFRGAGGQWSRPANLGDPVNNGEQVRFPAVSSDGRWLFFTRANRPNRDDVFWVDARVIERVRPSTIDPPAAPAPAADSPRAPAGDHAVVMSYVANEGLLIAGGGQKILIDALFTEGWGRFAVPSAGDLARMREAAPPFDQVTALLLTHHDGDHFDPALVIAHLRNDSACVFLGPAQADAQLQAQPGYEAVKARVLAVPRTPAAFERTIQGRPFKALLLEHQNEDPSRPPPSHNVGLLFSVGGVTFLHAGDTGECDPAVWRRAGLGAEKIDVLILPWFFFTDLPAASVRRLLDDLRPKAIVLVHLPAEASAAQLIPADRTKDLPPVFAMEKPMAGLTFDRQGPDLLITALTRPPGDAR